MIRRLAIRSCDDGRTGRFGMVDLGAIVSLEAQRNRLVLLGLMTAAGFEFYANEWWHYQLLDARDYSVVAQAELPHPVMD